MADDVKDAPVTEETSLDEAPTDNLDAKEAAEVFEETPAEEAAQKAPVEEPKEDKKASKATSKNLEEIIEKIEKLSVLELADLVHALEDRFGVTAAAPMAVAAAGSAPAGEAGPTE